MDDHPLIPRLERAFSLLASSDDSQKRQGQTLLQSIVDEEGDILLHRAHPVNSQNKTLVKWIGEQLNMLFQKPESKLGGVRAIKALVEVEYCDINTRTMLFSSLLSRAVTDSSPASVEAAKTWGDLLSNGCGLIGDLVEAQSNRAMEWLCIDPKSMRRFSACLFLKEIVKHTPSHVINRLDQLIVGIWAPLRDPLEETRLIASSLLQDTLLLAFHSSNESGEKWANALLDVIVKYLPVKQAETVHGALLAFNDLLFAMSDGDAQDLPTFSLDMKLMEQSWGYIIASLQKLPSKPSIRRTLLDSMPLMAKYEKKNFAQRCLPELISAASIVFKGTVLEEKTEMFITIGKLGGILKDKIKVNMEKVVRSIENNLISSKKPKKERCEAAVTCLAMLAKADPATIRPYILPLTDALFSGTPSVPFAKDISALCTVFPEFHSMYAERLLQMINGILKNITYRDSQRSIVDQESIQTLLGALEALQHSNFEGCNILPFLVSDLVEYLSNPNDAVREATVELCSKLVFASCFGPGSPCWADSRGSVVHVGKHHIQNVIFVQSKLLAVAVSDPNSDIRLLALQRLSVSFDATLALQEPVRFLVPTLNDKPHNRQVALRLIGRLSRRNPAAVFPILRQVMLQCTTEIQYFSVVKKQEQATTILGTLVESAPLLVRPYAEALLQVIVERLSDPEAPAVVLTALLSTVGKLVEVFRGDPEVVAALQPTVVQHILDHTSTPKRQEAIRALGSLVRATRNVAIYDRFPELLGVLSSSLHGGFKEVYAVRREVLSLMGVVGAVDPKKIKTLSRHTNASQEESAPPIGKLRSDDVVGQIVVNEILKTLQQQTTNDECCTHAVVALVQIFTSRVMKLANAVSFSSKIIPEFLRHIHLRPKLREILFQELTSLVSVVKHHVRSHLDEIFDVVCKHLKSDNPQVLQQVVGLLVELRQSLNEEFKPYLPSVLPLLVQDVLQDTTEKRESASKIFSCFEHFGRLLEGQLHIVLPCAVEYAGDATLTSEIRVRAVNTILVFAKQLSSLADHAARCIHCLCRILMEDVEHGRTNVTKASAKEEATRTVHPLHHEAMSAILAIVQNLGPTFSKFLSTVKPILNARFGSTHPMYINFLSVVEHASIAGRRHIIENARMSMEIRREDSTVSRSVPARGDGRYSGVTNILQAVDKTALEEEWNQWLRQFTLELLRESPSVALRVCDTLAQAHEAFARELFRPAFASCFTEMNEGMRNFTVNQLSSALSNPKLPTEVLQELLNLAEYMERIEDSPQLAQQKGARSLGLFDVRTLTERSESCSLHVKALHYIEAQFVDLTRETERATALGRDIKMSSTNWKNLLAVCEKMIYLYNILGQRESANGVLSFVQNNFSRLSSEAEDKFLVADAEMYEKLMWWSQSYKAYAKKFAREPRKVKYLVGMMNALDAQGDFQLQLELWKTHQKKLSRSDVGLIAPLGARAAWNLQSWGDMEEATKYMSTEGYVGTTATFYQAVLCLQKSDTQRSRIHIEKCRRMLDGQLSALIGESYERAYRLIIGLQQLSELEEIASAIDTGFIHEKDYRDRLTQLWGKRLDNMSPEPTEWQGTLVNHSLLLSHDDELSVWLRLVELCRTKGRIKMAEYILLKLQHGKSMSAILASNEGHTIPPLLGVSSIYHVYEFGEKKAALQQLHTFTEQLEKRECDSSSKRKAVAQCHFFMGEWKANANSQYFSDTQLRAEVLAHYKTASELDPTNPRAWHSWAQANQQIAAVFHPKDQEVDSFVAAAAQGLLESICLSYSSRSLTLEDVLSFLSLWFTYGGRPSIDSLAETAIGRINVNAWLGVIPQIIARIHTKQRTVKKNVRELLCKIAQVHPQALLYPLNVNVNVSIQLSTNVDILERKEAAVLVLDELLKFHGESGKVMVGEAQLVSRELIRCAVLWHELWSAEIEEGWKIWSKDNNAEAVWATLEPLHAMIAKPETPSEEHFKSEFYKVLSEAANFVLDFLKSRRSADMAQAWEIYISVFSKIERQLPNMTALMLQYVSPRLLEHGRNLGLVVPGQYDLAKELPRIVCFVPSMKVFPTKQRPRKIAIIGSDGLSYQFLLKGNEDMRQDERVMQVLGLVNMLLEKNPQTLKRDLLTVQYSATPLNDNAGLLGWVEHCDTLNLLIHDYREMHKIPLNKEHKLLVSMVDKMELLTVIQKVELFEYALENGEGMELARMLWVRSPNAEVWLDRRTTYVRTLSTMSMTGYIIGLGDRHPSNLMMHADSGRIVHIDFGDCFEVAMHRAVHPEKVPFRLTRMLVKAMEVCGIDGLFRHSCEAVMGVLRIEKNSLMAMLEAFVHDPLLSWRLVEDRTANENEGTAAPMREASREVAAEQPLVQSIRSSVRESVKLRAQALLFTQDHVKKAQQVISRIREKLNGTEFADSRSGKAKVDVKEQVDRLIVQAMSHENLCQCWIGWCPFW